MSVARLHSTPHADPLSLARELAQFQGWHCRTLDEMLCLTIPGRFGEYEAQIAWHDEPEALQFLFRFAAPLQDVAGDAVKAMLAALNPRLFLGHFECSEKFLEDESASEGTSESTSENTSEPEIFYRYTWLLRLTDLDLAQLEAAMLLALDEIERFIPAFQLCAYGITPSSEALSACLLEPEGQA